VVQEENLALRRYAIEALGEIGPQAKAAIPALTQTHNSEIRSGHIDYDFMEKGETLDDLKRDVRRAAGEALEKIRR
jgi:HEAT repeat protein